MATLALKGDGQEDDIQEIEVLVRGIKEAKVTTILQLLSPIINDASAFY